MESTITFKCDRNQHESEQKEFNIILQLSVVDRNWDPIQTLNEILNKHFEYENIGMQNDWCQSDSAKKNTNNYSISTSISSTVYAVKY